MENLIEKTETIISKIISGEITKNDGAKEFLLLLKYNVDDKTKEIERQLFDLKIESSHEIANLNKEIERLNRKLQND